jgi:hypothetical protein
MMGMHRTPRPLLALALAAAAALGGGCGKELTAGGQRDGEVVTYVTSEEGGPGQSLAPADGGPSLYHASHPAGSPGGGAALLVQGDVVVDAQVSLLDGSHEVPLHATPASAAVRIEAADSALLVTGQVEAAAYTHVRVRFSRVEAQVRGGLPLLGLVKVDMQAGPVVVDIPVPVQVRAGARTRIVIDLNAHQWLPRATPALLVARGDFQNAVTVRVH